MLCTQILVQSYYLDAFSFHLSVKSHVFHVMCTDFSSIIYLDTFSVHISVKSHVTMLSKQILVQSYTWTHFQFTFLLNLMFTMLSTQISYKYHIYAQCILQEIPINRILHLNYHVMYTDFSSILLLGRIFIPSFR